MKQRRQSTWLLIKLRQTKEQTVQMVLVFQMWVTGKVGTLAKVGNSGKEKVRLGLCWVWGWPPGLKPHRQLGTQDGCPKERSAWGTEISREIMAEILRIVEQLQREKRKSKQGSKKKKSTSLSVPADAVALSCFRRLSSVAPAPWQLLAENLHPSCFPFLQRHPSVPQVRI